MRPEDRCVDCGACEHDHSGWRHPFRDYRQALKDAEAFRKAKKRYTEAKDAS